MILNTVTWGAGGSGGDSKENEIIERTISGTYSNSTATIISGCALAYCYNLESVYFPACTSIGDRGLAYCYSLASISFPICSNIGPNAFYSCRSLTTVSFPSCITVGSYAF